MTTSTSTTPCTTGKSLLSAELATRLPTPGMANTASITTAPENSRLTCRPSSVSKRHADVAQAVLPQDRAGAETFGAQRADILRIEHFDQRAAHLARKLGDHADRKRDRRQGRVHDARPTDRSTSGAAPVVGNQCSSSDSVATRIMASQKLGSATPSEASPVMNASSRVPTRVAASTPSDTPTAPAITSA